MSHIHTPQSNHTPEHSPAHDAQTFNNRSLRNLGSLLAVGAIAFGANINTEKANAQTSISPDTTPATLVNDIDQIVSTTASSWRSHQLPDGRFVDPAQGTVVAYGAPMIGQAMIETGVRTGDAGLLNSGILSQVAQTKHPDSNGFNIGFEVFGMSHAYKWNEENLADYPNWQSAQPRIAKFLNARSDLKVGKSKGNSVEKCFTNSGCWSNLKLVKAFANISLAQSGVRQDATASKVPATQLSSESRSLLVQAKQNSSANAKRTGGNLSFSGAGILSDPSRNPLAYHALSAMLLGRVAEDLGPNKTPQAVTQTLQKNARALTGLIAPDGDTSYIGRGQGQVWVPAATANALAIAAKHTTNKEWRGRYLKGVALSIQRIQTKHTPGTWGMPVVPKHLTGNQNSTKGIDSYASTTSYNGLALEALRHTAKTLSSIPPTPLKNIGPDTNGSFVDPTHTQFASTKRGNLWWAVHAGRTHTDLRYDFGLVAVQKRLKGGQWKSVLPERPLTKTRLNGSLSMIQGGRKLVPTAGDIKADGKGKVSVNGGWTSTPNKSAIKGTKTKWTFQQKGDKQIEMRFRAPKTTTYRFQLWYEKGSKILQKGRTVRITEPDGTVQRYSLNNPVRISKDNRTYSSAYTHRLASTTISTKARAGKTISYKTGF